MPLGLKVPLESNSQVPGIQIYSWMPGTLKGWFRSQLPGALWGFWEKKKKKKNTCHKKVQNLAWWALLATEAKNQEESSVLCKTDRSISTLERMSFGEN